MSNHSSITQHLVELVLSPSSITQPVVELVLSHSSITLYFVMMWVYILNVFNTFIYLFNFLVLFVYMPSQNIHFVEWEGGDEWIRAQFKDYLQSLMASVLAEGLFHLKYYYNIPTSRALK